MLTACTRKVDVHAPTVDQAGEYIGFSQAIGTFHSVIDTLGDEANLINLEKLSQGINRNFADLGSLGVVGSLSRDHGCNVYISSLTQSQNLIVEEGLLFGRGQVKKHQQTMEQKPTDLKMLPLTPPLRIGTETFGPLLENGIIFKADYYNNENGNAKSKSVFTRGWSFSDFSESAIWPRYDSTASSSVRFGFPASEESIWEEQDEQEDQDNEEDYAYTTPAKTPVNPYVLDIPTVTDLEEQIIEPGHDCVLFVSAHYCKLCASLKPEFTRLARQEMEKCDQIQGSRRLVFANANTRGKWGKNLTDLLDIDFVPNFVLFKGGKRYGQPLGALKLPSEQLNLAIEYLKTERLWDMDVFKPSDEQKKKDLNRPKLQ